MSKEAGERFKELSRRALEAREIHGLVLPNQLEPFLVDVLNLAKSLPAEDREDLAQCFKEIVYNPAAGPWEIVQFCMRELQWPEVRQTVQEVYAKEKDLRTKRIMERILDVYNPYWEEAAFWNYYADRK